MESYAAWSLECYEQRVQPLLREEAHALFEDVRRASWLETCDPGAEADVRHRLFPGSLMILWVEALGGPEASRGVEPVAAALECLHNASLVHDDILDRHEVRRRQPTLFAAMGAPFALLGGDGLLAAALVQLGKLHDSRLSGCLARLGRATEEMIAGQWLDEPATWARIEAEQYEEHWLRVCRGKLALGNVAGPLGAFLTAHEAVEGDIAHLAQSSSVVSQIINDFGDTFGWTGYHELAPDWRQRREEARQKPTLPAIWSAANRGISSAALLARARQEIERRRSEAVSALSRLELEESRLALLMDFFARPGIPENAELHL